jgi:AcrR family transcriptional regulator
VVTPATTESARRDAKRNRERLVASARELFAARGVDVPAREVARHAGVGVGTLYRHFPERADLVDAVLAESFEELIALAEASLGEDDAWRGFRRFVEEALVLHGRNRGLKDVVETNEHGRTRAQEMRRRLRPLVAALVERAQKEGGLRSDFTPQDIALLFWGSDRVIELAGDVAPELWRRQLGFVLDGLRAADATPLDAPPLTDSQLQRIGGKRGRKGR